MCSYAALAARVKTAIFAFQTSCYVLVTSDRRYFDLRWHDRIFSRDWVAYPLERHPGPPLRQAAITVKAVFAG
jgi:hypothetical protein